MTTLAEWTLEIRETNQRLGWLDNGNTWGELAALLHTEIAEMVGHYRRQRFARHTTALGKPDDVGAELADATIRFLSMCDLAGFTPFDMDMELADVAPLDMEDDNWLDDDTFGDWVSWLHRYAAFFQASRERRAPDFLRALVTFAERWGINLTAEVERKAAHNATREPKHGGTISDRPPTATDLPGYMPGGGGPRNSGMDWTTTQEERAAGLPSAQAADYSEEPLESGR